MLKVIQLSDCHVSAQESAVYRGINPRETLEALLNRIDEWHPDLLLATGDLAEDASPQAYQYLAKTLGELNVPVLSIPGNHDDGTRQLQHFPYTAIRDPLHYQNPDWRLVLLNSAVENQVPGALSDRMIAGLESLLSIDEKPTMVVLHHQPIAVGSPWIDRYPLQCPKKFWSVLEKRESVKAVMWGHIHHGFSRTEIFSQDNEIALLGSPSTAANSLPEKERFTFDPAGPACRWLQLHTKGQWETGILALEA